MLVPMVLISHEDHMRFSAISAHHERRESTRYNSGCPNSLIFFDPLSNTKNHTQDTKEEPEWSSKDG